MMKTLVVLLFALATVDCSFGPFGPPYPVTAAWFKDRYSEAEWNQTLTEFAKQGGDTVILNAPSISIVSEEDLLADPDFQWCKSNHYPYQTCYDEVVSELSTHGIKAEAFATYKYEEDFDEQAMLQCPPYDMKIVSSRVYYRLVLPLFAINPEHRCNLTGFPVLVVLTTFAGVDPHELLLRSASMHNMSVFFGLPQPMVDFALHEIYPIEPYFEFVRRILTDHKARYSKTALYTALKGYSFSFEFLLLDEVSKNDYILATLATVGRDVHMFDKRLLVSTYFKGNKFLSGPSPMQLYINAFELLVNLTAVDVISVKDGRGSGHGAYYWETQKNAIVEKTDEGLYQIIKANYPTVHVDANTTYSDLFWTSVQQMFFYLAKSRDQLASQGNSVDLWLTIESYDYLHDDPCLPIDTSGSGMDQMLNRVTKQRLDWALTQAGAYVQKVAARAWDPEFTCTTKDHPWPLRGQVAGDSGRPIIANCSFHSSFNRSVVVIGYNLDGLTQGFTVDWPHVGGHRVVSTDVHGYYFELDWGIAHHRVPSLMYTQLYDPYDVIQLAPKGYVRISADAAYHGCAFTYDFTTMTSLNRNVNENVKKYYAFAKKPKYRVYGQDIPFH